MEHAHLCRIDPTHTQQPVIPQLPPCLSADMGAGSDNRPALRNRVPVSDQAQTFGVLILHSLYIPIAPFHPTSSPCPPVAQQADISITLSHPLPFASHTGQLAVQAVQCTYLRMGAGRSSVLMMPPLLNIQQALRLPEDGCGQVQRLDDATLVGEGLHSVVDRDLARAGYGVQHALHLVQEQLRSNSRERRGRGLRRARIHRASAARHPAYSASL